MAWNAGLPIIGFDFFFRVLKSILVSYQRMLESYHSYAKVWKITKVITRL